MPRIDADSLDEHVRIQTARILDAALALFRSRGYRGTDLHDIAESVGLARNSLYRYYPNKDHLLVACVKREMGPFVEQLSRLAESYPEPLSRIGAWLDALMDMALGPAHVTLELMNEIRDAAPELRREIMTLHKLPNSVLEEALTQLFRTNSARGRRRDIPLLAAMIAGMVQAAATQGMRTGHRATVKRELRRAVEKILEG